jgi:hypothetical protein
MRVSTAAWKSTWLMQSFIGKHVEVQQFGHPSATKHYTSLQAQQPVWQYSLSDCIKLGDANHHDAVHAGTTFTLSMLLSVPAQTLPTCLPIHQKQPRLPCTFMQWRPLQ